MAAAIGGLAGGMAGGFGQAIGDTAEAIGDVTSAVVQEIGATFRSFTTGPGPLPVHVCNTAPGGHCKTCRTWLKNWREHRLLVIGIIAAGVGGTLIVGSALAKALSDATGMPATLFEKNSVVSGVLAALLSIQGKG